ncbi:MAG: hypothetical protein U9R60_06225 [Bacteroidota bacterium]|nr:hypothetical protein [Bacteroidota bacterium]
MRKFNYALISMGLMFFFLVSHLHAQNVVISDDNTYTTAADGALLDLHSQNGDLGILIPGSTDPTAITPAANGLLVYDSDDYSYYFYSNNTWVRLCGPSGVSTTYGEMFQPLTSTVQSIPIGTTWIGLNNLQTGTSSGITFTDDNTNGDYLLIPSGGAGAYKASITVNGSGGNNNVNEIGIFINGNADPEPNIYTSQEFQSDGSTVALTGFIAVSDSDQIRIKIRATKVTDIVSANVNLIKLD